MKVTRDGRKIDIRLNEKDIAKMKKDPRNSSVKCPYCKEKIFVWADTTHRLECLLMALAEIKKLKETK